MARTTASNAFRILTVGAGGGDALDGHAECFKPGKPSPRGRCYSDGWYRCDECTELAPAVREERFDPDAVLITEFGR